MTTTLRKLFAQSAPDENVLDEIGSMYLDRPLEIRTMSPQQAGELVTLSPGTPIKDCARQALGGSTKGVVRGYKMDVRKGRPIVPVVIDSGSILDGHHRAMAAFLENVPLQYVDVGELSEAQCIVEHLLQ